MPFKNFSFEIKSSLKDLIIDPSENKKYFMLVFPISTTKFILEFILKITKKLIFLVCRVVKRKLYLQQNKVRYLSSVGRAKD